MCKVLHIEDSSLQVTLVDMIFAKSKWGDFKVEHATTLAAAEFKLIHNKYDIILADLNLLDSNKHSTISRVRELAPKTPIIVVSCEEDYDIAMQSIHDGGEYYLNKAWELKQLPMVVLTILEKKRISEETTNNLISVAKRQMTEVSKMSSSLDTTISKAKETTRKLQRYKEASEQYGRLG